MTSKRLFLAPCVLDASDSVELVGSTSNVGRRRPRILPHLATVGGSRIAAIALQALILSLQARALTVAEFGLVATVSAVMFALLAASDFGFSVRALRLEAESNPGLAKTMVAIKVVTVAALIVAAIGVAVALQPRSALAWLAVCSVASVGGESCGELCVTVLLGQRRRLLASGLLLVRRGAPVAPFALFGVETPAVLIGLLMSGLIGYVTALAFVLRTRTRLLNVKGTISTSLKYWGPSVSGALQRLDVVVVSSIAGLHVAGLYGAATRLGNPLSAITAILLQVVVPDLSATDAERRSTVYGGLVRLVMIYAAILILAAVFAPAIATFALGETFRAAWPVVAAVFLSAAVSAFAQSRLALSIADGLPRRLPGRMVVATLIGLGVLAGGAGVAGTWGAASGLILLTILVTAAIYFYSGDSKGSRGERGPAEAAFP